MGATVRAWVGLILLVSCGVTYAARESYGVLRSGDGQASDAAVDEYDQSDAEPVDPAEQRPAVMPPQRPQSRGVVPTQPSWIELGPAPTEAAQVGVPPDNEVSGAVQALAPHPTNADILYAATVNGGIWRTNNATAARPSWVPLTDNQRSLSTASIAFDPTDVSLQTLVVGTGRVSNFAQRGDDEIGVYRTTNGGVSWTELGGSTLLGQKLIGVSARGAVLMAASRSGSPGSPGSPGLYRSVDSGATWALLSGNGSSGLPAGGVGDLAEDPLNANRFYVSVLGSATQVYRSNDGGATWVPASSGITGGAASGYIRLSVGANGIVYAAMVPAGTLTGVFRSIDLGVSWTAMDVPPVHPGGQGFPNTSLVGHPTNPNLVFVAGDRITAPPFTGNVRRGDATLAAGTQFTAIMDAGGNNTTPHADSRDMAFDANGNLLQSDDGGIYRRLTPTGAGAWVSVNGNMNAMEVHDLDHDRVSNVIVIGTQDNGTHMQQLPLGPRWRFINGGDGGDVAIDSVSLGPATGSYRYISSQNLGGFRRAEYDAGNIFVANRTMPGISGAQFVTPVEVNKVDPARLMVGGSALLFISSNANTGTPTYGLQVAPGANRNAMAFGATTDPNAAYVGQTNIVYRRSGNTFVATTALPAGAGTITDVAMDIDNPDLVWAVDDNQVFRSINGGTTWVDITGNLPSISSLDFRTIEFMRDPDGDRVAIGTRSGVYVIDAAGSTWSELGQSLPDVLVFDLRWIESQRRLIAGTLGRGVWGVVLPSTNTIFSNSFEP
jgi:hypothetical protein